MIASICGSEGDLPPFGLLKWKKGLFQHRDMSKIVNGQVVPTGDSSSSSGCSI